MKTGVVVLGASDRPERYAYQAVELLRKRVSPVWPVNPRLTEINGLKVYPSLKDFPGQVDTVTVYLNADLSSKMVEDLLRLKPRRIILNPGAENDVLKMQAQDAGIQVLEACTLVMLRTSQY